MAEPAPPIAPADPSPASAASGTSADQPVPEAPILGANPFVGMTIGQAFGAAGRWAGAAGRHPTVLASEVLRWGSEELRVVAGVSGVAPAAKDRRFADPAWEHPVWRRVLQSYLVTRDAILDSIDRVGLDEKSVNRARFALGQVTEACAPTNALIGNPAALKLARSTKGRSLLNGGRHWLYDVRHNGGLPSQVDTRPFRVGETIAVTEGAVVFRTPMFELIQYKPTTPRVVDLPTVIVPPQINRYYFLDLAPGRSFVEHAVGKGIPTFLVSWRNPGPDQRDWGMDDYAIACIEALRAAADISGTEQVNAVGFCSGGMTLSAVLSHLANENDELVNAATLAVTMIDSEVTSALNMFASERTVQTSIGKSRRKGVLDGRELAKVFAWVRPNDLIWNYWVSNYLMGQTPAPFDVLAWNSDSTNLPARLHAEFLQMWLNNSFMKPGSASVLGSPIDLRRVKNDLYVVGALTDHLVPWTSAYSATQAFGGTARFVLSNSGHIQALVNPPGNPKASFSAGDATEADPMDWLKSATREQATWWQDWVTWTTMRSGPERARPRSLGNRRHKVVDLAPGRYVRE